jgi:2-oxoglutarate dehydrogenase E2 component (dihydrolipoamide succinyltransferase)
VIAIIDMDGESTQEAEASEEIAQSEAAENEVTETAEAEMVVTKSDAVPGEKVVSKEDRFYSPLVRKIAREENIPQSELDGIQGSGINGRVQKRDILSYLENRKGEKVQPVPEPAPVTESKPPESQPVAAAPVTTFTESNDEVVEMSRLRKLIAEHMVKSKQTSAHVTNMIEVDVTNVVTWRTRVKDEFLKKEGVKITYLPVFLEATVKALRDFPQINSSVDGDKMILKKRINLGVAVALPDNNLIVPNIKDADALNLVGLTKKMNELAQAARSNKLSPDDISGGTFTVTNFGTFQNDIGTPIINQPEVAILAVGAIKKKPAVLETDQGDVIAIRQKMWLSLTYDHRIIDGALGGAFLKKLGDYIESFDPESGSFKL